MPTIYDETLKGTVICLMGENRQYAIGDVAYRFARPAPFPNGMAQTLPNLVRGTPVMWIESQWKPTQDRSLIVEWNRPVTLIDTLTE